MPKKKSEPQAPGAKKKRGILARIVIFLLWIGLVALHHVLPSIFETWFGHMDAVFIDPLGGL